jgi:hypothetical protein
MYVHVKDGGDKEEKNNAFTITDVGVAILLSSLKVPSSLCFRRGGLGSQSSTPALTARPNVCISKPPHSARLPSQLDRGDGVVLSYLDRHVPKPFGQNSALLLVALLV